MDMRKRNMGRRIYGWGNRKGIPRWAMLPVSKVAKIVAEPAEWVKRKHGARKLVQGCTPQPWVPDSQGYRVYEPHQFEGLEDVISVAENVFEERGEPDESGYINQILDASDARYKEFVDFALQTPLLAIAARYIGSVPVLQGTRLWWTPAQEGEEIAGSQQFHRDKEDLRQLKLFVNIQEISDENGPFSFLPADVSEEVYRALGRPMDRVDDEEIFEHCDEDALETGTGPRGQVLAVDTSRCFHYGGRVSEGHRLVLQIQYTSYHNSLEVSGRSEFAASQVYDPGDLDDSLKAMAVV